MTFKVRYRDDFINDYKKIIKLVDDPRCLDRNLREISDSLFAKQAVPAKYVTNALFLVEPGWYECFVYTDKHCTIIMQYKIKGHRIYLSRLGTPAALMKKYLIFAVRRTTGH